MFRIARWHTAFGLVFAILGMLLGIVMASTHNHTQHVTHAHILLLGFATSLLYGLVLRAWVPDAGPALTLALARVQVALHQVGTVVWWPGCSSSTAAASRSRVSDPCSASDPSRRCSAPC